MIALGIILAVLCLLFLGVLVWRAFEAERRDREEQIVKRAFPSPKEPKDE